MKLSETSIKGNKITQDPDKTIKETKVGGIIEGNKFHQYLLHLHMKIGKTTKVVQMIRHVIPIHVKLVILQAILIFVQETWMKSIKIKNMKITLNLHI